jgi:hypothetical protein
VKLTTIAMFGAGYVLGTKAGRERYDQLRELGRRLASELDGAGVRQGLDNVSSRLEEYANDSGLAAHMDRRRAQARR